MIQHLLQKPDYLFPSLFVDIYEWAAEKCWTIKNEKELSHQKEGAGKKYR